MRASEVVERELKHQERILAEAKRSENYLQVLAASIQVKTLKSILWDILWEEDRQKQSSLAETGVGQ